MHRLISLACIVFFLFLFGNFFLIESNAQPTSSPNAIDDAVYVVRTLAGDGTLIIDLPNPGILANDIWNPAYPIDLIYLAPSWSHASAFSPSGGGFLYKSNSEQNIPYVGIDSAEYKLEAMNCNFSTRQLSIWRFFPKTVQRMPDICVR